MKVMVRLLTMTLWLVSTTALAQAPAAPVPAPTPSGADETLLAGPITHGGFGGPMVAYTRLNGEDAVLVGGRGGWLINHRLLIGGGGWGIANRISVPAGAIASEAEHRLTFGYGGFWTEYIVQPSRLVHGSVGLLIGGGELQYARVHGDSMTAVVSDPVFVMEPSLNAEVNLASFVRLTLSAGYRFVAGVDLNGLDAGDVAGFVGGAMLKFGSF